MDEQKIQNAVEYIESWLDYQYERSEMPGFAVSIQIDGKLILNKAWGYADLESNIPLTSSHLFRIASHSKTFTATAVMQLQEQGKLKIDDYISVYLPWLKKHKDKRWQNITIRQVLSHSAGIVRDGLNADYWSLKRPFPDKDQLIQEVLGADLVVDNNTRLKYSNFGYSLLGMIIEEASGENYEKFITKHILKPLKMTNTGTEFNSSLTEHYVTGYTEKIGIIKRIPIANIDTRAMASATGFYSTAADLCKYFNAHLLGSGQLLSDESKKEMQRSQWQNNFAGDFEEKGLSFGFENIDNSKVIGHGGGFPGQITQTSFDPKSKIIVSVLTNCIDGKARALNTSLFKLIDWFDSPKKIDQNLLKYRGRFANLWGTIDIVSNGEKVLAISPDSFQALKYADVLELTSPDTFKITDASAYSSYNELVEFKLGAKNGSVDKIKYAGSTMQEYSAYKRSLKNLKKIDLA